MTLIEIYRQHGKRDLDNLEKILNALCPEENAKMNPLFRQKFNSIHYEIMSLNHIIGEISK